MMKKVIGLATAAALSACALAGGASASSNYPDGTVVTATNSGNISFSGIVTCGSSGGQASLTNLAAGSGITLAPTSWTFSSCTAPVSACNLSGWDQAISGGGATQWSSVWSNVCLDVTIPGACRYEGTLSGLSFDEATDLITLAGSLTRTSGTLCNSTITLSGKYALSPSDLDLS